MVTRRSRPRPASSPIRCPRKSSWRRATKPLRCFRRWPGRADVGRSEVVLVIDNYDSFTYNLVQYLGELGERVVVNRNDQITLEDITRLSPLAAVLSPGPGTPGEAGICKDLLLELGPTLPTLGVCLGHQCLGEAYGGPVGEPEGGGTGKRAAGFGTRNP